MRSSPLYGGIEAGGTKFVCVVAGGPAEIVQAVRFPTTSPEETIRKSIEFSPSVRDLRAAGRRGCRCLRPAGCGSRIAHVRLYHLHTQTRLDERRPAGNVKTGAGCANCH